ncbi:MAG: hypothetical protein JWL69_2568 [Phycisphaerales bacterium]|nr:hypothetical protein [Phycisphaerales bacterium]
MGNGTSPPRISISKAVAKSARKLGGTTRRRRPVFVGGAAAQVWEYRPLGTRAFNRNDNRKRTEGLTPAIHFLPWFRCKPSKSSCKLVQIRAWHPVALSKMRFGSARRVGAARQNAGATGRAGFLTGNARKVTAGLGLRRVCAVRATPKTSRPVAQCRAEWAGVPSGHLSARAPQCSKCATGVGRCAVGEGRFG